MAHRVLSLGITDEQVKFTLLQLADNGGYYELESKDYQLKPDKLTKDTIDLLVKLQYLLADALRRSGKLPRADVDEALCLLAEVLGKHLYSVLFNEYIDTRLNDSMSHLRPIKGLLRIELDFQGESEPSRSSWPWEYLYSPQKEQFVALLGDLVLSRKLSVTVAPSSFTTVKPKILLVVAGPSDEGPVVCQAVIDKVRELKEAKAIELVELIELIDRDKIPPDPYEPTASLARFKEAVEKEEPDIIHFIGHGQREGRDGQLAFVGTGARAQPVTGKTFASVASKSTNLKLVFLQACESALPDPHSPTSSVARELFRSGIPAVVAMQAKVENEAANTFASRFYDAIGERQPVDFAVMEGREAVKEKEEAQNESRKEAKERPTAFGVPVLYLRRFEPLIAPKPSGESQHLGKSSTVSGKCPRCGENVDSEDEICSNCGLRLWCANPECKRRNLKKPLGNYCDACGKPILPSPPWPKQPQDQVQSGVAGPVLAPVFVPPSREATRPEVPPTLRGFNAGRSGTM